MKKDIAVLLHNIRSAHNVGSIFRTADAAGVSHVYLSGYTPLPKDRFGRIQKEIAKVALGAEVYIPWERRVSPRDIISGLQRKGWKIVGVEQDQHAKDYRTFFPKGPTMFIFGNEVRGLPKSIRTLCEVLIEIPMYGRKESLNVSVAAGIILFNARQ